MSSICAPDSRPIQPAPLRLRIAEQLDHLNDADTRRRLYAIIAAPLFLFCMMLGVVKWRFSHKEPKLDFASNDGKYYYLYIASVMVDGDLDFHNQMREQWPEENYPQTENGAVLNKYPIGVSLSLLPSFFPAHEFSRVVHGITDRRFFAANGYTILYQVSNLAWVFILCWATFVLIDRVMMQHFSVDGALRGKYIAAGVLCAWLGTQYAYHAMRFPLMANVISTFWVTATIAVVAEAVHAMKQHRFVAWHWPVMVFCTAMAIICRPTNVMVCVFGFFALYQVVRQGMLVRLLKCFPWLMLALFPIALQMIAWHIMFGHWITYSYAGHTFKNGGTEKFYWTDPVLFKSLFSLRAGLFVWCPVFAIGTFAAVFFLFREIPGRWLVGCSVAAFVVLWYFDSAWWCWPFSGYPSRAYLEMVVLPALGITLLFHHSDASRRWQRILVGVLLVCIASTYLLEAAYDLALVPRLGDTVILLGPAYAAQFR